MAAITLLTFALFLLSIDATPSTTPAPTIEPVVTCHAVDEGYCSTAGAKGCFSPTAKTCAQCNYPAAPTSNPNGLLTCSSANVSKSCSSQYPSTCAYPCDLETGFKSKRQFQFVNQCEYPIWVGMNAGNDSLSHSVWASIMNEDLLDGGFKLDSEQTRTLTFPALKAMNIWARTNCAEDADGTFQCDTGSCSSAVNQMGKDGKCCGEESGVYKCSGPASPESIVEITLAQNQCDQNDFYDVGVIDGYNIPVSIEPFNYTLNDTINHAGMGKFACGAAKVNVFNVSRNCPDVLKVNGNTNRNLTETPLSSFNFSSMVYCLGICKAVNSETHRAKFDLLQKWYNAKAFAVLNETYSASQLSERYITADDSRMLFNQLCCQCGDGTDSCYEPANVCEFGCSPFLEGGWDATPGVKWTGTPVNYQKRECINNGYANDSSTAVSAELPMWPLLPVNDMKINPAYIYKETSPNAYSWQYNDQSSTFQCRNADYKIVFCHQRVILKEDIEEPENTQGTEEPENTEDTESYAASRATSVIIIYMLVALFVSP
eukprot:CAMPEP_0197029536 /NCGR_PEP_ID=MMETSP1384-20130603/8959_1 /TAXON_ID=29189 /ORGANISM="Ammonia sp." /LENGTH=543 /DNA_ID=CAMNT_0042458723 /DNA_START=39 /DNA_END=1670 /DNA_ORIENTATION=+